MVDALSLGYEHVWISLLKDPGGKPACSSRLAKPVGDPIYLCAIVKPEVVATVGATNTATRKTSGFGSLEGRCSRLSRINCHSMTPARSASDRLDFATRIGIQGRGNGLQTILKIAAIASGAA